MFYVDKKEITTHWWACAGHVEEQTGKGYPENNDFDDFENAHSFAYLQKLKQLESRYQLLKNRYSSIELFIYSIRAIWNPKIREGLERYNQKLQEAKKAAEGWIEVQVTELPQKIPVLGDRIALGTRVYTVYTDTLTLYEDIVISENIQYYSFHPNGVVATYTLAKRGYVESMLKSGYSNVETYLDKEEAKARLLDLIMQKQAELEEQLKSL
jgi:hypothetical protein